MTFRKALLTRTAAADIPDPLPENRPSALSLLDWPREPGLHACRLEYLAAAYSIPPSTLRALDAAGRGPRTFRIGRLLFCRIADWRAWLDQLADRGGARVSGRRAVDSTT
jgi:hypothetical protein